MERRAVTAVAPRFPSGWRSLTEHGSDPVKLHNAARALGIMLADGRISDDDAYDCVKLWVSENPEPPNRSGLQARLCAVLGATASQRERDRGRATAAASNAGRPLIERRMPSGDIIKAATRAANAVSPGILGEDEIRSALRDEWNRVFGHGRRR